MSTAVIRAPLARPSLIRLGLRGPLLLAILFLFAGGCDALKKDPAVIDGVVLNSETDRAVASALVELRSAAGNQTLQSTSTDEAGNFSFTVDVDSVETFRIVASKTGFHAVDTLITVPAEQTVVLHSPLKLVPSDQGPVTTGEPRSVTLARRSAQAIGVHGSGSVETATLHFAVLDGNGVPLDAASSVKVRFRMLSQPSLPGASGAEFIYPAEATTNENGEAKVTLTSGTTSGPVQLQAEVETAEGLIRSSPVVVAIHGGLPDQEYFTVSPVKLNFAGRAFFGEENVIRVIVGDQYANPVQANTNVYFTTDHGVIEGSAATDELGRASVILQSANPLPPNGLGTITARTVGVDGASVSGSTLVLFSGKTKVELRYDGGSLETGGLNFTYWVTDDIGNPVVEGSTASVTVDGEAIQTIGQTSVTIPDALGPGPGITEFQFRVRSTAEDASDSSVDAITINVTSRNGSVSYTWMSWARPVAPGLMAPDDVVEH